MELDGMPPASPAELDRLEGVVEAWLAGLLADQPDVVSVDRGEPGERRWYVHLAGETKDLTTVWLTLGQRALHVETYLMPAPERNQEELFAHLLRRNRQARGMWLCIGEEDAVYLVGQFPVALLDAGTLDLVLGSAYAAVERLFKPAVALGFGWRSTPSR